MSRRVIKRVGRAVSNGCLFLLTMVTVARADETFSSLKVGTNVYHNVTVMNVTATDIYFSYAGGMGNAKLKSLDPQLQQHFHYNAAKAAKVEANQQKENAMFHAELAAQKPPPSRPETAENESASTQNDDAYIVVPKLYAKSFLGHRPPKIILGKWLTLAPDLDGKFVLIDFWATWCGPCRRSIPHLNDLYNQFRDRLVVIGISNESEAAVRRMTSPHIDYAIGIDPLARTARAVGVTAIPDAMLIDPKGIVRFEGMPEYLTADGLERLMDRYGS